LSRPVVLDSFAILALLRGEPGAPAVRQLIEQAIEGEVTLLMSQINLGEVIYHTERVHGVRQAQETLVEIEALPIQMVEATRRRVLDAAHIKANHRIAYADAFAATLAREHGAALVTGDPEFRALGQAIKVEWLAQVNDLSE
jgi:ribonuclease VapC